MLLIRGGSRAAATSKMKRFVIIVNSLQPLTVITKRSILNVAAALDPRLLMFICRMASSVHDLISQQNFVNTVSALVTSGISPKF